MSRAFIPGITGRDGRHLAQFPKDRGSDVVAGDDVRAMWPMLQQDEPDDDVIATGETHTIEEFVDRAFAEAGADDWRQYVRQDPTFCRPAEVDLPTLVKMMVEHDLKRESAKAACAYR